MNRWAGLVPLVAGLAWAGCTSTSGPPLVLERVGPVPVRLTASSPEGYLQVHPAAPRLTSLDDPDLPPRVEYRVLSADRLGQRRLKVRAGDVRVPLEAGQYTVEALAVGQGRVCIPVAIEAGRTTVVRLGGQADEEWGSLAASELVFMPDGRVVGWRAE